MNYTYSISEDTLNGKVAVDSLKESIESSSIIFSLSSIVASGDSLQINFKANIGASEKDELDSIVASHDGNPLVEEVISKYAEVLPQGGQRVTDRGFQFEAIAGQETVYDFQVTEDLFVKEGFAIAHGFDKRDYVSMSIVHPALQSDLHFYLKDLPLEPHVADKTVGKVTAENKAITETNFNGLIIRMRYKSHGAGNVHVCVTMRTYS
jgi:hypothetical protein